MTNWTNLELRRVRWRRLNASPQPKDSFLLGVLAGRQSQATAPGSADAVAALGNGPKRSAPAPGAFSARVPIARSSASWHRPSGTRFALAGAGRICAAHNAASLARLRRNRWQSVARARWAGAWIAQGGLRPDGSGCSPSAPRRVGRPARWLLSKPDPTCHRRTAAAVRAVTSRNDFRAPSEPTGIIDEFRRHRSRVGVSCRHA